MVYDSELSNQDPFDQTSFLEARVFDDPVSRKRSISSCDMDVTCTGEEVVIEEEKGEEDGDVQVLEEDMARVENVRERAYSLCRDYLHGAWRSITAQQMVLKQISGGLSNLLYYCALPPSHPPRHKEPAKVLLRLYGQIHGERALEGLITESVIFTLLSESQRGPRLFGVFPGGRLEEFIPARALTTDELSDPTLSCLIAEKMALVHMMDVPINKEPHWLWDTMDRWMDNIKEFAAKSHNDPVKKERVQRILSYNLIQELHWLKKFLKSVNSPVVFCHNDLQEGNILLRNSPPNSPKTRMNGTPTKKRSVQMTPKHQRLVVIDFEYCSYNYRGFDFANHMCEWLYDYTNEQHPYFWARTDSYPTQEQQERFIVSYLRMMQREQETEEVSQQEVTKLLAEIRTFTLASHFFWGLWSFVNASVSTIPFDYWEYGEARFSAYFRNKTELSNLSVVDGII
uniref:Choline kinase n=1 Tax=Timema genevievae TaxID=629358 RepID=A0A7R9JUH4_TIMGE|nr:unnamed protein product [Timema genevievae]